MLKKKKLIKFNTHSWVLKSLNLKERQEKERKEGRESVNQVKLETTGLERYFSGKCDPRIYVRTSQALGFGQVTLQWQATLQFQWLATWKDYFSLTSCPFWVSLGSGVGTLGCEAASVRVMADLVTEGRGTWGSLKLPLGWAGAIYTHISLTEVSPIMWPSLRPTRRAIPSFQSSWLSSTTDGEMKVRWKSTLITTGGKEPWRAVIMLI